MVIDSMVHLVFGGDEREIEIRDHGHVTELLFQRYDYVGKAVVNAVEISSIAKASPWQLQRASKRTILSYTISCEERMQDRTSSHFSPSSRCTSVIGLSFQCCLKCSRSM